MKTLGKWVLDRELGSGAMATVYLAHDSQVPRIVRALKVIHGDLARAAGLRQRFLNEVEVLASLHHPNIPVIHEYHVDEDRPYLVTDFLDGRTLKEELEAADAGLPWSKTLSWSLDALDALGFAHAKQIIHRDVKPSNLFLCRDGRLMVIDFGLAKQLGDTRASSTLAGGLVGTPAYMAPELDSRRPHPGSDIYALGITMYELLAGRHPFCRSESDGEPVLAMLAAHREQRPPDMRPFVRGIPEALVVVVERAMDKDPSGRFRTAEEMSEALRAVTRRKATPVSSHFDLPSFDAGAKRRGHPPAGPPADAADKAEAERSLPADGTPGSSGTKHSGQTAARSPSLGPTGEATAAGRSPTQAEVRERASSRGQKRAFRTTRWRRLIGVAMWSVAVLIGVGVGLRATYSAVWLNDGTADRHPRRTTSAAIAVGAMLPLTGDGVPYGLEIKRGLDLAAREINATGGISGRSLEILYEDVGFDVRRTIQAFEKLVSFDHVPLVLGPILSGPAIAVAPLATHHQVVVLSAQATSPRLSGISPFFFRIAPPDNVGTKRLVDWMVEDGAERIAVVFSDDEYGRGQKDVGVKRLQEIRMSPVELASCPRNTEDHRALAVRVRSAKPDSVLLLTGGTEAGPFLRAARDLGFAPRFYGDDSLGSPYLAELAGRAAEGARFLWPTEGSGPLYEAFAKSFRRAYKGEPGDPAMRGYSLLVTAAEALENTTLDGPALRAFLSKHAVDTPMGIVAFDQNGDIVNPRYDKHEYRNGDASTLASE